MGALAIWRFLGAHPLARRHRYRAALRVIAWQVRSRLLPGGTVVSFVDGSQLFATRGMTGATGNVYAGLHEFEDMGFVAHALRPGDLFVDVGANVGSYTVLAAARGARCVSFEPIASTRVHLERNVEINGFENLVEVHGAAVGRAPGELLMTADLDTVNHVATSAEAHTVRVPVETLDGALGDRSATLIKIDVEGFEAEVIGGAARMLAETPPLAFVIELNDSAERYRFDEDAVVRTLTEAGYGPCSYDPLTRALEPTTARAHGGNTIFVRDLGETRRRVREALPFTVLGERI